MIIGTITEIYDGRPREELKSGSATWKERFRRFPIMAEYPPAELNRQLFSSGHREPSMLIPKTFRTPCIEESLSWDDI
jgi:hypothetical protein